MPYGPRYGRMEDPQEAVTSARKRVKLRLLELAITEQDLSWHIKTRYGEDRWPVVVYDLQWREGLPGALVMVDRDTDMDVRIYPAGMWFSMDCVIPQPDGGWTEFLPHQEYLHDLADKLTGEEEDGTV